MQGEPLGDRYEILRRIGSGGMATVYLARDLQLKREVAVKLLDLETAHDPTYAERFRREALAAASLNHPNVVAVYDWAATGDTYFMVMEYVPGADLRDIIRREGPLPEERALDIASQVASALQAAHDRGIIHRDIKPHNVLVEPGGQVKVVDFGIARTIGVSRLTATNAVTGTAHYMSPEQVQLQPIDARSDVYSLGIVLYEMLAGVVPYSGESMLEAAMQHVHGEIPNLAAARPDLAAETVGIVNRALARRPEARFANAAEMAAALQRAREGLDDASGSTTPSPVVPPVAPPAEPPVVYPPTTRIERAPRRVPPLRAENVDSAEPRRRGLLFTIPIVLLAAGVALAFALGHGSPGHHSALSGHRPTATIRPTRVTRPTSVPPTLVAVRPPPTLTPTLAPTVPPIVNAAGPAGTVQRFYADVLQGADSAAATLWTGGMQARCAPLACIDQRFQPTTSLDAHTSVVSDDGSRATVSVDLVERQGATLHHYRGNWYLVRSNGLWLMDNEDLVCYTDMSGASCPAG